jgi:hypothetical protein
MHPTTYSSVSRNTSPALEITVAKNFITFILDKLTKVWYNIYSGKRRLIYLPSKDIIPHN